MQDEGSSASPHETLKNASSIAAFRSSPIVTFHNQLRACLRDVVLASCQEVRKEEQRYCYWKIDSSSWKKGLLVVSWQEICQYHDHLLDPTRVSTCQTVDSTTPLQEIVTQLLDPCVVPRAFAVDVVDVLIQALLQSPRRTSVASNRNDSLTTTTRWTNSQLFLLHSIACLWTTCPNLRLSFMDIVEGLLECQNHLTPHKWNRLLSIATHLAVDCPQAHSTMLLFILKILEHGDQMETKSNLDTITGDSKKGKRSDCRVCQKITTNSASLVAHRLPRGVRIATLQDLHGKDITTTNYRPQNITPQRALPRGGISLKNVLSAKGRYKDDECKCHYPISLLPDCNTREISDDWTVVRARSYKKFHILFHQIPIWKNAMVTSPRTLVESSKLDLHRLLQIAHDNYRSPCIRLCILLIAHNASSPIYSHRVCRMIWSRFETSKDPIWLRFFSENVATWSCFDDHEQCWIVIRPLVDFVLRLIHGKDDVDSSHHADDSSSLGLQSHHAIFRCLAYILSRRSNLLSQGEEKEQQEFQSFVTSLEIHCGEIDIWFTLMEQRVLDQNNGELQALQKLGILGITDFMLHDDIEELVHEEKKHDWFGCDDTRSQSLLDGALHTWPFSYPYDLRSAYERAAGKETKTKFIHWNKLLSSKDFNEESSHWNDGSNERRGDRKSSGPPLTDYIDNHDLLLQVFQNSNYQDIFRCRQVCKVWKSMIDSSNCLWREVYISRFPVHPADARAHGQNANEEDWKRLLIQKVSVERTLLYRRNQQTGYKHQICSYIGCYQILKSERSEVSHFASHARQDALKVSSRKQRKSPSISKKPVDAGKVIKSTKSRKRARAGLDS